MMVSAPAIRKGHENSKESGSCFMKKLFRLRPTHSPRERAIFVIPLAADRYSLETTIETKVCLAGTSICEIEKRANSKTMLTIGV